MTIIKDDILFLFDEDIYKYLTLITNSYAELCRYYNGKEEDTNLSQLQKWLSNQYYDNNGIKNKFKKYHDLPNYGLLNK